MNKEQTLLLLLEKEKNELLPKINLLNLQKREALEQIEELKGKLAKPSSMNLTTTDITVLMNYTNFFEQTHKKIEVLGKSLETIEQNLLELFSQMEKINYQQELLNNKLKKIEKKNTHLLDKKNECEVNDLYNLYNRDIL